MIKLNMKLKKEYVSTFDHTLYKFITCARHYGMEMLNRNIDNNLLDSIRITDEYDSNGKYLRIILKNSDIIIYDYSNESLVYFTGE